MYEQLKFIKDRVPKEILKMKPEDICIEYQKTKNDALLCAMFSKVFDSIYSLSKKYTTVDTEDIVSNALTCLNDVMLNFDVTQKIKFDTYFSRCFERVMYAVFKPQMCKKRIPKSECVSMQEPQLNSTSIGNAARETTIECILEDPKATDSYINIEILELLRNLTPKKHVNKIFMMLYEGYTVEQIRNTMPKYSESTIRNIIFQYKKDLRMALNARD